MRRYDLFLLLLSATFILTTATHKPIPPLPPPGRTTNTTTTTLPPSRDSQSHRQQLDNIIDALIGAGDFYNWANILSMADPSNLPISATLFIPGDDSRSPVSTTITVDPLIFPYHVVPQRLSFSDLLQFKLYYRLPTLLASKSILITNNSISNYTLDGSLVSHPDVFTTSNIAVHGISTLLDYSIYGEADPKDSQQEVVSRPPTGMFAPAGEVIADHPAEMDDAGCLCPEVWSTVLLIFCVILGLKIQRMNL